MKKLRYVNKMINNPKNKVTKIVLFLCFYATMLPNIAIAQPNIEKVVENIHYRQIGPTRQGGRVGTHGRSIFIADISPLQELSPTLLKKDIHFFKIEPKVQWRMTSQPAVSAQNFAGENEPFGVSLNYYLKNSTEQAITFKVYKNDTLVNELTGTNKVGINTIQWGMTKRRLRTAKEIME